MNITRWTLRASGRRFIRATEWPSDIATRDQAVADASRRFLEVVLDSSATEAVLTWGLSDRFLKPSGWRETLAGYSPRTLPLDADMQRTPMWRAMARVLATG